MSSAEVTPELLQKGFGYDALKAGYDEAQPVMELFSSLAKQAGMSVPEYTAFIRTEAKKAQGMSQADAKRAVELEDRERAVAASEAKTKQQEASRAAQGERIRRDVAEFSRAFPEIYAKAQADPKVIPEAVWKDVSSGLSLTAAWSRHVVRQAEQRAAAADRKEKAVNRNAANAARSAGSMVSAGAENRTRDPFAEAFDAG